MESEFLKAFREKYKTIQPVSMPDSLAEVIDVFPELTEVPESVIRKSWDRICWIFEDRKKCKTCTKESEEEVFQCGYKILSCEIETIFDYASYCDKQQYYIEMKRVAAAMDYARVGARFRSRRFETYQVADWNKKAYDKCLEYAEGFPYDDGSGLIMIGGYGTGKTHLAVSILHRLLEKQIVGVFVTVPELLAEIRKTYSNSESGSKIIDIVKTVRFLILDDLGAEKPTDWVREQLFMLINARYEDMLSTVITSNCKLEQLEERIGQRTVSRIVEMCDGILLDGKDYRLRKVGVG